MVINRLCETLCEPLCELLCEPLCETLCETLCEPLCELLCKTLCKTLCETLRETLCDDDVETEGERTCLLGLFVQVLDTVEETAVDDVGDVDAGKEDTENPNEDGGTHIGAKGSSHSRAYTPI